MTKHRFQIIAGVIRRTADASSGADNGSLHYTLSCDFIIKINGRVVACSSKHSEQGLI